MDNLQNPQDPFLRLLFYKPTTTSHFYFNFQMADQQDLERIWALQKSFKPTTAQDWKRSDKYHNSFLIPKDDVLDAAVKNSTEQGLPDIAVSEAQGKFLHLLAKSIGAKKILEVGTLGG